MFIYSFIPSSVSSSGSVAAGVTSKPVTMPSILLFPPPHLPTPQRQAPFRPNIKRRTEAQNSNPSPYRSAQDQYTQHLQMLHREQMSDREREKQRKKDDEAERLKEIHLARLRARVGREPIPSAPAVAGPSKPSPPTKSSPPPPPNECARSQRNQYKDYQSALAAHSQTDALLTHHLAKTGAKGKGKGAAPPERPPFATPAGTSRITPSMMCDSHRREWREDIGRGLAGMWSSNGNGGGGAGGGIVINDRPKPERKVEKGKGKISGLPQASFAPLSSFAPTAPAPKSKGVFFKSSKPQTKQQAPPPPPPSIPSNSQYPSTNLARPNPYLLNPTPPSAPAPKVNLVFKTKAPNPGIGAGIDTMAAKALFKEKEAKAGRLRKKERAGIPNKLLFGMD